MKRSLIAGSAALLAAGSLFAQQGTRPASIDGTWTLWRRQPTGIDFPLRVELQSRGDSVTVTAANGLMLRGLSTSSGVTLTGKAADKKTDITASARWVGDSLVGRGKQGSDSITILWLVRDRVRPVFRANSADGTSDLILPCRVDRAASRWRISGPGDTVHTETVDAGGTDSSGKRRSAGGNPLTGPFYIENSLPGDVLVIHLLRVRTNRSWAVSGASIAFEALDPGYIVGAKDADDSSATGRSTQPPASRVCKTPSAKLKNYTVPLHPMLGSIAVALASARTRRSAEHGAPGRFGGNMDHNRFRVKARRCTCRSRSPARTSISATATRRRATASSTGDALADVDGRRVLGRADSRQDIGFPRAEDASFLMASGIGGSLDQAFRTATTRLAQWLEQDYKLSRSEVAIMMGTAVQYDIGEWSTETPRRRALPEAVADGGEPERGRPNNSHSTCLPTRGTAVAHHAVCRRSRMMLVIRLALSRCVRRCRRAPSRIPSSRSATAITR